MSVYDQMSREQLLKALEMFAKNWLAHDGCWFLAAEESHGMETAMDLDGRAWKRFAAAEARRVMQLLDLAAGGGLQSLARALEHRMYAVINEQHIEWNDDASVLTFEMDACRVQQTRRRKGLEDFPCKPIGEIEFSTFAGTVDPRIETRCIHCPPETPAGRYCRWEFRLGD